MATNSYLQAGGLLGVNIEGNEPASSGTDGTVTVPRVQVLTPVFLTGNRTALYVIAKTALNPSATVVFETTGGGNGTVVTTTGDASGSTSFSAIQFMVTLNIATASTGDFLWARTSVNLSK